MEASLSFSQSLFRAQWVQKGLGLLKSSPMSLRKGLSRGQSCIKKNLGACVSLRKKELIRKNSSLPDQPSFLLYSLRAKNEESDTSSALNLLVCSVCMKSVCVRCVCVEGLARLHLRETSNWNKWEFLPSFTHAHAGVWSKDWVTVQSGVIHGLQTGSSKEKEVFSFPPLQIVRSAQTDDNMQPKLSLRGMAKKETAWQQFKLSFSEFHAKETLTLYRFPHFVWLKLLPHTFC